MYIISFRRYGVINKKTQYGKSIITNTVISAPDIALRGENKSIITNTVISAPDTALRGENTDKKQPLGPHLVNSKKNRQFNIY